MGVLKKLTSEYFGDTERKEDAVVMDGVERVDFVDNNGVRHRNGYRVKDANINTLYEIIKELIGKRGPECDLNDVDVSNMVYMHLLFSNTHFNGDISGWDVSKVTNMGWMFMHSAFNGDISKWKVTKVLDMKYMFFNSKFDGSNGDISGWEVNPDCDMTNMFDNSPLMNNPPKWYNENR